MLAIFKREFKALFQNVIGWLFVGVTLAFFGLYLTLYNLVSGYSNISYPLSGITFVFIITVPILTMRILAEERKNKTDQLILTSPVSVGKIVFGKFLALATTFTICIAVMCIAPIVLNFFGDVPFLQDYVAIFGFWLYGLTCIAIGLFVSSLTESQVVSAILTVVILFIGFMMGSLISAFSAENMVSKIFGCYDLITPLQNFLSGTFSLVGTVYYISLIALLLFLTVQSIQKRRWTISVKKFSTSVFSGVSIVIAFAIIIAVNILMAKLPKTVTQFDATASKLYTLQSETKDYLSSYKKDTTIYVLGKKAETDANLKKTLSNMENVNDHLKVTFIDTNSNPTFVSAYTDQSLSTNSMIVVCGDKNKIISADSIYTYEMDSTSYTQKATGYDAEGQIISALSYVTTDNMPIIYELTSHDEKAMSGDFLEVMQKANISVTSLSLLTNSGIPDNAAAVIINAPQSDYSTDDIAKLKAYVDAGGKLMVNFDFLTVSKLTNLKAFLADYGVGEVDGVVADLDSNYYYNNSFYLLPNVESSDLTADVAGKASVFTPYDVGLTYSKNDSCTYTPLMTTSDNSISKIGYADRDKMTGATNQTSTITKEDGDIAGPFTIALKVDIKESGSLYIFGSSYTFLDESNDIVSGRNATLFEGVINGMIPEDDSANAVVIPTKAYGDSTLTTTAAIVKGYGILWSIVIPILSIFVGIVVTVVRKRK